MPNISRLPDPFIKTGDPITAKNLNLLARAASRTCLAPGQFQNGRLNVQAPQRGGGPAVASPHATRVGLLLTELTSGGTAEGVLLERDPYGEWVEEAASSSPRVFEDALDDGTFEGIRGEAGRRCIVFKDIFSDTWIVSQVLRSCDYPPPPDPATPAEMNFGTVLGVESLGL